MQRPWGRARLGIIPEQSSQRPGAEGEVRAVTGDSRKGLQGQNKGSALEVFSEGDNITRFLTHKDECLWSAEWPAGAGLGKGRPGRLLQV